MRMGLEFVRTLTEADLFRMVQKDPDVVPNDQLNSFKQADLVIESTLDGETQYAAVEISYTGTAGDAERAIRNANFLTQLTGCPATPVVASVETNAALDSRIESGSLHWHHFHEMGPGPGITGQAQISPTPISNGQPRNSPAVPTPQLPRIKNQASLRPTFQAFLGAKGRIGHGPGTLTTIRKRGFVLTAPAPKSSRRFPGLSLGRLACPVGKFTSGWSFRNAWDPPGVKAQKSALN